MAMMRRTGLALFLAGALSVPALAMAEQAPTELCDGDGHKEGKEPTADNKSNAKSDDKSNKRDGKSDQKPGEVPQDKESDKRS